MKRVLYLLGQLDDLDIEWMINNGDKFYIDTGDRLINKGQAVENLFIVLSGELSVVAEGGKNVAFLGAGEVIGEMSFLESKPPSVFVIAAEKSSVFAIPKILIESRLNENPKFKANFYYALALFLSNRLRKTTSQLGYGEPTEEDLIDHLVLDDVSQAGSRFSEILHKFSEV